MNEPSSLLTLLISMTGNPDVSERPPRILLRSSWQTVNIGDIGHTPGVLRLIEEFLPAAKTRLWAVNTGNGVEEMLKRRFSDVPIIQEEADVAKAFDECDFLLHGSGPSLVASKDVKWWRDETGKPYGVFGITLPHDKELGEGIVELLCNAKFVYFRDSVSLQKALDEGVRCPVMEFGPDGAFGVDVRDDDAAEVFLEKHGLEPDRFLCCVPRYRYTPYWTFEDVPFNPERNERNESMKEHDHVPLRKAIIDVVRQTDLSILLCPEDMSQMAIGKEMLFDKLPDDVKERVICRDSYWLTDEAVSTYVRSAGLFGLEMHSPIMCVGNGIPAIVGRFHEQTSKGEMWRDIGLGEWLFDMDAPEDVERYPAAVLAMASDPTGAKAKAEKARRTVRDLHQKMIAQIQVAIRDSATSSPAR